MVPAYQSSAIIIAIIFWNVFITNLDAYLLKLAVRKLESKMNMHADRVTGEGFVTMGAPKQCEKYLVKICMKREMKAEWKK